MIGFLCDKLYTPTIRLPNPELIPEVLLVLGELFAAVVEVLLSPVAGLVVVVDEALGLANVLFDV